MTWLILGIGLLAGILGGVFGVGGGVLGGGGLFSYVLCVVVVLFIHFLNGPPATAWLPQ